MPYGPLPSGVVRPAPRQNAVPRDPHFVSVTLWLAQAAVAIAFIAIGSFKLTGPMSELIRQFKWPGEFAPWFTRALGLIDLLGGIGIVLPALTRIRPRLTVWAAVGATLLQVLAIGFHTVRGEVSVLPLNGILLPLAAYVAWGRSRSAVVPALEPAAARRRLIVVTLWAAQCGLALVFCGAGWTKLSMPMAELSKTMPWAGDFATWFVRLIGVVDLAGGVGVLLPSLTRVLPRLSVVAAEGCIVLQLLAMALHASRGEWAMLPFNAVLIGLAAYTAWGRGGVAAIAALRGDAARARVVGVTLWAAQAVVAAVFIGSGMFKLGAPIGELAMTMKWAGEFPHGVVRLLGAIDLAGGLGILLPALTRIRPRLTVLAALGCSVLQVLAIAFHVFRGEIDVLPLNFLLLPCALFVLWGRAGPARIPART